MFNNKSFPKTQQNEDLKYLICALKITLHNNYQSKELMRDYNNEKFCLNKLNQVLLTIKGTSTHARKFKPLNKRMPKTESLLSIQLKKDANTTRDIHNSNPVDQIGEDENNLLEMIKDLMQDKITLSQNLKDFYSKNVS